MSELKDKGERRRWIWMERLRLMVISSRALILILRLTFRRVSRRRSELLTGLRIMIKNKEMTAISFKMIRVSSKL